MTRVLTIVGARPQFIKAAAVSRQVAERPDLCETLVHTGQHYDSNMSDVFFEQLGIPLPAHHLGIGSGPHGAQTGRMLEALEGVMAAGEPPAWVLVYGDTNSTLAGALAAAKLHIPVAHVEAGLRSFNRLMPEEVNRVLTDHCSDLLFAPTAAAVDNLRSEGIPSTRIRQVGDVMYDAALYYGARADSESTILADLGLGAGAYILGTVHRAENTDRAQTLRAIVDGLAEVASEVPVVIPLHPRTRGALEREGLLDAARARLRLVDPVGYLDMVMLEKNAALVVTDSGGVQKEAFFFQTPCVTVRTETEWVELVELGWNRVAPPTDASAVAGAVRSALGRPGREATPYGDGSAAAQIVKALCERED